MLKINELTRLHLGIQGENLAQEITIDVSPWITTYPNGSVTIWHKRNGDAVPQPTSAVYDPDEKVVRWSPTATDTYVAGEGVAEIRLIENSVIKKSRTVQTFVADSVTESGTPVGSSWQDYINVVDGMRAAAVTAQEAAEDAQTAAETAQGKAEDAQDAAETAQGKAEDAQTAAETAQGKAEDAQTAAETAQGKADDAQTAAETAQDKAEDAQTAAETAQGKAEDAQTAAETAQGKAEDAQTAAETAEGKAEDAKEAAESAREMAEDARDAAQAAAGDFQGLTATASGLAAGAAPTVEVTHSQGGLYNLAFGIPKGDKGDTGDPAPAEQVQPAVNAYLAQVITNPDSPPLDRTLTSSSAATPADITGSLKSAIEYETQSNIDFFEDELGITNYIFKYNDNKSVETNVDVINIDESTLTAAVTSPWKYCIIPCAEGDKFHVKISKASSARRPWAFIQSNGTKISAASTNNVNVDLTAPANSAYLVCNVYIETSSVVYSVTKGTNRIDGKQDKLIFDEFPKNGSANPVESNGINNEITDIRTAIGSHETAVALTEISGKYWNNESTTVVLTDYASYKAYSAVSVNPGEKYHEHGFEATSQKTNTVIIVDSNYEMLAQYGSRSGTATDLYFKIPKNGAYVLMSTGNNHDLSLYKISLNSDTSDSYNGCKLSLLGDSFSAISGYSTDGHNYYPNPSKSDVENVNQMWWKIVADYFKMTPLVVGAWSGSTVASGVRSASSYTPASDPSRCQALDDGINDPDVVLIAMGVNDYSYMSTTEQFGTWDGTTALGGESDLSDYVTTDFKRAYATMLARIQKSYPDAFIVCITPWFQKRRTTDTGANYLNAIGKSISDYADAVREICSIMHVSCINGTDIGFNRWNYYPTYCQDAEDASTHPNITGQAQIAKAVIAQLKTLHKMGS